MTWIQYHLEILSLKQILFEFLSMDQCFVSIARPSARQHMEKSKRTLYTFVDEMRDDVFKLLSLFDRKETLSQEVLRLFLFSFLRLEVSIHTHKTSHATNIFICKCLQVFENTQAGRFCSNIQQDTYLRIELPAKPLEKPKMR